MCSKVLADSPHLDCLDVSDNGFCGLRELSEASVRHVVELKL